MNAREGGISEIDLNVCMNTGKLFPILDYSQTLKNVSENHGFSGVVRAFLKGTDIQFKVNIQSPDIPD